MRLRGENRGHRRPNTMRSVSDKLWCGQEPTHHPLGAVREARDNRGAKCAGHVHSGAGIVDSPPEVKNRRSALFTWGSGIATDRWQAKRVKPIPTCCSGQPRRSSRTRKSHRCERGNGMFLSGQHEDGEHEGGRYEHLNEDGLRWIHACGQECTAKLVRASELACHGDTYMHCRRPGVSARTSAAATMPPMSCAMQ